VITHPELPGRHQLRILPEHGPGASARTARSRHSTPPGHRSASALPMVEVRDLALYEALLGDIEIAPPLAIVAPEPNAGLALPVTEGQ
jgi:hypothetical protein